MSVHYQLWKRNSYIYLLQTETTLVLQMEFGNLTSSSVIMPYHLLIFTAKAHVLTQGDPSHHQQIGSDRTFTLVSSGQQHAGLLDMLAAHIQTYIKQILHVLYNINPTACQCRWLIEPNWPALQHRIILQLQWENILWFQNIHPRLTWTLRIKNKRVERLNKTGSAFKYLYFEMWVSVLASLQCLGPVVGGLPIFSWLYLLKNFLKCLETGSLPEGQHSALCL